MGYNTIAFLLNDCMHEIRNSPHAVTHILTHPPHHVEGNGDDKEREILLRHANEIAAEHGEPPLTRGGLHMLRTFHADEWQWLVAGWNSVENMKFMRFGTTKDGRLTVTLELPEKFPLHPKNRKNYPYLSGK